MSRYQAPKSETRTDSRGVPSSRWKSGAKVGPTRDAAAGLPARVSIDSGSTSSRATREERTEVAAEGAEEDLGEVARVLERTGPAPPRSPGPGPLAGWGWIGSGIGWLLPEQGTRLSRSPSRVRDHSGHPRIGEGRSCRWRTREASPRAHPQGGHRQDKLGWTKRLRRGMGGAGWVGCSDWEGLAVRGFWS